MSTTNCRVCGKEIPWPESYCRTEPCRSLDETAAARMSMPLTVMRSNDHFDARKEVQADLAKRRSAPHRTLSVSEAARALGNQSMSPEDSARLNNERENDMLIRAAGLLPRGH
jgi:hypothetical protein